jgi:hypothetical protein
VFIVDAGVGVCNPELVLNNANQGISGDRRSCLIGDKAFGYLGILWPFTSGCKFYSNHLLE